MIHYEDGTAHPPLYTVGVDLGDARDYTSVVILERSLWVGDDESGWRWRTGFIGGPQEGGWVAPDELPNPQLATDLAYFNMHLGRPAYPAFRVRHAERLPLGSGYLHVVDVVGGYMARLKRYHPELVVDHTGVGRPVIQSFRNAGLFPVGIHLHAGADVRYVAEEHRYNVPVRELVASAQLMLENKRLQIAAELHYAETLKRELLNFRRKINPQTAHESYSAWRESEHDDLVFALSMCVWRHVDTTEPIEAELETEYMERFGRRW